MPLYGFLEGDTLGLLILAHPGDRVAELAEMLMSAALVRAAPLPAFAVMHGGQPLDQSRTLREVGLKALDRFDVVRPERA